MQTDEEEEGARPSYNSVKVQYIIICYIATLTAVWLPFLLAVVLPLPLPLSLLLAAVLPLSFLFAF